MSEIVDTYDVKEFEIKQFLGDCTAKQHSATLYSSGYNKRSDDNWLVFFWSGDGDNYDFRGIVLPYRVANLINRMEVRVDHVIQRVDFRTRSDMISAGQWCGCERDRPHEQKHPLALVIPISARGWRHIEIRIRCDSVEQHQDITLHALHSPVPPPMKKDRWWWTSPFAYGMTASLALIKVLAEIL